MKSFSRAAIWQMMVAEKAGVPFSRDTDEAPVDGSTPMPIRSNTQWTLGVTK